MGRNPLVYKENHSYFEQISEKVRNKKNQTSKWSSGNNGQKNVKILYKKGLDWVELFNNISLYNLDFYLTKPMIDFGQM